MIRKLFKYALLALLFCALMGVLVVAYIDISTARFIYGSAETPPQAQTAIVLGASVASNGTLSPVMQERADKAAELYRDKIVSKILVTGDNSTLQYDEVYPVGKYLLALGIPEQDIFLDYAGFDTYSSMYRARNVFDVTDAIIVSQQYHLPRAVFIARIFGIQAYAVDASKGEKYLYYSLREIPASLKAALDIVFQRMPKYLGTQIPISGSSATTWLGSTTQMIYFNSK